MKTVFHVERWRGHAHGGWELVVEADHLSEAEDTVGKLGEVGLKAKHLRILVISEDAP